MDNATPTPQPTAQDWATLLSLVLIHFGANEVRLTRKALLAASAHPMRLTVDDEGAEGYLLQLVRPEVQS